jgi:hypothetical protein
MYFAKKGHMCTYVRSARFHYYNDAAHVNVIKTISTRLQKNEDQHWSLFANSCSWCAVRCSITVFPACSVEVSQRRAGLEPVRPGSLVGDGCWFLSPRTAQISVAASALAISHASHVGGARLPLASRIFGGLVRLFRWALILASLADAVDESNAGQQYVQADRGISGWRTRQVTDARSLHAGHHVWPSTGAQAGRSTTRLAVRARLAAREMGRGLGSFGLLPNPACRPLLPELDPYLQVLLRSSTFYVSFLLVGMYQENVSG